jgi:serine/threonine protein kinase
LAHPNIVSLLDAATSSVNDSYVIAVARLIPHQQVPDLTTSVTWAIGYARNVLEGLKYLHKQRIIHRDVKPSNVMYCSTDRCWKLIDFDLAVQLSSDESLVTGRCGTKCFIAPEMERGEAYGVEVDLWSFGATLEALFGQTLCHLMPEQRWQALRRVRDRSLQADPQARITASAALQILK